MKVGESINKTSNLHEISGKEDRKVADSKETSFHGQLRRVETENFEERVRTLANKIFEQGEKLGQKMDVRELKIYKSLISEFMDEVVGNSQKFSKESFLDRRGRYKVYCTVKKINEEVDNLTKDVLSAQKDNIKILQRLEDIRGLILDLTL